MAQTKVDYPALEREFIAAEETPSLRKMAEREGISNSTLSDYARKHKWADKRETRVQRELDEFMNITAEKNARRLARLSEVTVDVLEGTLIRFAEQLTQHLGEDGKPSGKEPLFISPKDVQEAIRLIQLLRGSPTERTEENVRGLTVHTVDPRLLEALGASARRALQSGGTGQPRQLALVGGAEAPAERVAEG